MSKSGKHGAVWSDHEGRFVNSPAFQKRKTKSQARAKAAKKARRANRD